jgi:hypothetical protein
MKTQTMKFKFFFLLVFLVSFSVYGVESTEKWDIFEISINGPSKGNPYKDVQLKATFSHGNKTIEIHGFYDGEGVYKIRFMPATEGEWSYITSSNIKELNNKKGKFNCVANTGRNHGPVKVANKYHFAYADGTPFKPFGTTCYVWTHQTASLQEQTLQTLSTSPFNKIRMCIFPKNYEFNHDNPEHYPFQGYSKDSFDFERFNPDYWHNLEKRLMQLGALGIEADMILFHPYDGEKWGFDTMSDTVDDFYLRYVVSRLSAFRNVWWSLANEFHFMKSKTQDDWDRYGKILTSNDPYDHLLSIHNGGETEFDWSKNYVNHVSAQHWDLHFVAALREKYQKPVINDEPQYEGNLFASWGNISARELVHRYWFGAVNGIYTTHGETYLDTNDVLWWSKGGILKGESPARIAFLKKIMEEGPAEGINNYKPGPFWTNFAAGDINNYLLLYFGPHQPGYWYFDFPDKGTFAIDIIDPWNMTIETMEKTFSGKVKVNLPVKPNLAFRTRKID